MSVEELRTVNFPRASAAAAPRTFGWSAGMLGIETQSPHAYVLLLRFLLANLAGFALLGAAWMRGWVEMVNEADSTYLSHVIFGLFLVGLGLCGVRVWRTSHELNKAKDFDSADPEPSIVARYLVRVRGRGADSRAMSAANLRMKLVSRISPVRFIANMLVLLGLIGTVIGFIIALSGVNPETSGDASAIGPMVATLISGMSVALYTTLIGAVLNIWLMVNYQILASGTVSLATAVIELGEARGR